MKQSSKNYTKNNFLGEEINEDQGVIRCICGEDEDDGFTIQCEECLAWQHASCVGIAKSNIPEKYYCEVCSPKLYASILEVFILILFVTCMI